MFRPDRYTAFLGVVLLTASAGVYFAQVLVFRRTEDTFYYMVQDLAFVPVQVLLVTLILTDLLSRREKRERLDKMNMVIGSFFSEVGRELLRRLEDFDRCGDETRRDLAIPPDWKDRDFRARAGELRAKDRALDSRAADLTALRSHLDEHRNFILRLLGNPNLLEHETFSDLLWAVVHLSEELSFRPEFGGLPDADLDHLSGDMNRAYGRLIAEWLCYVGHLKRDYPYIYSLALRTNPFDPEARVEVAV
jgi:hypothetical protein